MSQYSILFYHSLILFAITNANAWSQLHVFSNSIGTQLQGLSHYSVSLNTFSGLSTIYIFGGIKDAVPTNKMIAVDLITNASELTAMEGELPVPRYDHCSVMVSYKMYIFGGIDENGDILTDLWQFNSIFLMWTKLSTSGPSVSHCKMIYKQSAASLIVTGRNQQSHLQIQEFTLGSRIWNEIQFELDYGIVKNSTLWDTSNSEVIISLENEQDMIGNETSGGWYKTNSLTIDRCCMLNSPLNQIQLFIISSSKIYVLNTLTNELRLDRNIQRLYGNFECIMTEQWILIVEQTQHIESVNLWFFKTTDTEIGGLLNKQYPSNNTYFHVFPINNDIIFIFQSAIWILQKDCPISSQTSQCFYGQTRCQQGWTAYDCSIPSCPNSLFLFDQIEFGIVSVQCSNHGVCTSSGCQCDENWGGQDCSKYLRKQCLGMVYENWPVVNCECEQQTSGGNNCEVRFCYNDCSNNGICMDDGECECNSGYLGPDCSISIIAFPNSIIEI